jgi:hypothetical protein
MSTFVEPEKHTANMLASMAGCVSPDTATSAGATFLALVQSSTVEAVRWSVEHGEGATLSDYIYSNMPQETADGCVPVYTHTLWATFVDLGAYNEDLGDLGGTSGDMEQDARVSLFIIAERLIQELLEEILEEEEDDDE